MSDDDLIRDAVHELVAAAPAPKSLDAYEPPHHERSYRWMAIAAATILVIGGIAAVALYGSGDGGNDTVATTVPKPVPSVADTGPTSIVTATTTPGTGTGTPSTVPVTPPPVSAPATAPPSSEATTTSTTTSTTVTTTTTPPPTTAVPLSVEEANLLQYLSALADGRYDDAAVFLREGGLEPERRSDLRPLFDEYGDIDDLPARLRSWCEDVADCGQPDTPLEDIGGYWVSSWQGVTGYFRSGAFEGSPSVSGLPPRRPPAGEARPCPGFDVAAVREADLDGDGTPETIVVTGDRSGGELTVYACNTPLDVAPFEMYLNGPLAVGVLTPTTEVSDTLLIGEAGEASTCGGTYRYAPSAAALVAVGWVGCWGNTGESIGCRYIEAETEIAGFQYRFVGGQRLDDSSAMDVDVFSADGAALDSYTLALPDQIDQAFQIVEPSCNSLPVITEG